MSTVNTLGRHRAASASVHPLAVISKAVSSNAGSFGRQAAVVTAASALILSVGIPAQAAGNTPESVVSKVAPVSAPVVSVPASTPASFVKIAVASTPAPVVVRAVAPQAVPQVQAPAPAQTVAAAAPVAAKAVPAVAAAAAPVAAAPAAAAPAAAPVAAAPAPKVGTGHAGVVAAAYTGIGHPYVYGGTSTNGWDCSGFVQWAYAQAGISIPRVNQWSVMVPTSNPQPGDLVVQNGGVHVGIYVGNGMIISALNPSQGTVLLPASATGTSVFYTLP